MVQYRVAEVRAPASSAGEDPGRALVAIRPLTEADLDFAAALHGTALSHGFFAQLGERFARAYLRTYLASPFAVGLVAVQGGARTGMLVGTRSNRAHLVWSVRNHGVRLAVLGLAGLVLRPPLAARFLRTRTGRYLSGLVRLLPRQAQPAGDRAQQPDVAVLSHVAVVPSRRGLGLGRTLVEAFLQEVGTREVRLITLTGVAGAGGFYRRLGWQLVAARTNLDGVAVSEYAHRGRSAVGQGPPGAPGDRQ